MYWRVSLAVAILHFISLVTTTNVSYSVLEQSKPGTLIGTIPESISLIRLVSQASLPYMKYSFLSIDSNLTKYFILNNKTGELKLSLTEVLDREVVCQFDVICVIDLQIAIQSTHTQFFRKVLVSIEVIDINDHSPHFHENFTAFTISESLQIPTSFPLPSAIDKDTGANNSLQGYELFPKDTPFELLYSKSNANLLLRASKELDHESRDFYSFRIIARDGGSPPKEGVLNVNISIEDVNDNAPKFTQENYVKVVDETVSRGSLLFTITATDADSGKNGQVRYRLSPQQPANVLSMFAVDEILGDLRLVGDFQNAHTDLYKLDVEASDMADQPFTTKTTATIQVEDTINSRPKLMISYLSAHNYSSISEYANVGVAVAHILVRDTDRGPNGIVQCKLNAESFFELQNYDLKEYNIIVARPLDRESIRVHNVTVVCSDSGVPPLSVSEPLQVQITDENDNPPVFANRFYNVAFRENNEIDTEILRIIAVDADDQATGNGRVMYSLQDTTNGEFFINSETGVIKAMASFDYEAKREINFTVVAEDQGSPPRFAKAAVSVAILDENDQVPYFTQSRFTIAVSEHARSGDLVGEIKAFDFEQGDNGQFDIFLISGSGKGKREQKNTFSDNSKPRDKTLVDYEVIDAEKFPFVVRSNGSLFLDGEIDYETISSYELQVRVTDKGDPPLSDTATVVIGVKDENDNPPNILHPNVSEMSFPAFMGSDAPVTVFVLEAIDRDSGRNGFLVYTVTARNDSGKFEIDSEGAVKRTRVLYGRDAGTYKLSVVVMDSGSPPLSDIRTFFVQVVGGNGTLGRAGTLTDQYIVITTTLVCVTILLSVTIILIIVIMKRLDNRRKRSRTCSQVVPVHGQNSRVVSTIAEPSKMDKFKVECHGNVFRGDNSGNMDSKNGGDSEFGFSSLSGHLSKNSSGDSGYKVVPVGIDDCVSDSSGDANISDSGHGASDEDISISNAAAGDSLGGPLANQGVEFQSSSVPSGQKSIPKNSSKQPCRVSHRKHVTFKDSKQMTNCVREIPYSSESCGSDVAVGSTSSSNMCQLYLQQQFGSVNTESPLSNTEFSILKNSNTAWSDNNHFNCDLEYPHAKNSPRISPTMVNYANIFGRDSPVFPTTAIEHSLHPGYARALDPSEEDPLPSIISSGVL